MLELNFKTIENEIECAHSFGVSGYTQPHQKGIANDILCDLMQFRRRSGPHSACSSAACPQCISPHLSKIIYAISRNLPVLFVLPAFPGKSPNLTKVLGVLPDMAERKALEFLQHLCDRIKKYYSPGAQIILCSDGRVFSDVVGMRDADVTAYQSELSKIITESGFTSLSTFDLDDLFRGQSFDQMRAHLVEQFGEPLDIFKAAVSRGGNSSKVHSAEFSPIEDLEANRLYCGITRFLVEDAMHPGQTQSRTAVQKECRLRAYAVIQRSKAWGDFVESQFPNAVRLSIHPQACGSKKLGIKLIEPDNWLTPWHGVAVEVDGRFILMKRAQAEFLRADLIHVDGRPSHYNLLTKLESPNC